MTHSNSLFFRGVCGAAVLIAAAMGVYGCSSDESTSSDNPQGGSGQGGGAANAGSGNIGGGGSLPGGSGGGVQDAGTDRGKDDTGGPGGPVVACSEAPADRSDLQTPLTACSREVPNDVSPTLQCDNNTPAPQNCTAHEPCGAVTGCVLERNEAITSTVQTTYAPGPENYVPPPPPGDQPIAPMGTWMHGQATAWFGRPLPNEPQVIAGTDQPGSCAITPVRDLMIVAISTTQFGQGESDPNVFNLAYWCGACAEIVGRSGRRVRVQVVTQCTGCGPNAIDIPGSYESDPRKDTPGAMIDDPENGGNVCSGGAMPVDWRIVPCEACGGIVLSYIPGFNRYTPAFMIRNHRLPIVDAEVMHDGAWVRLNRSAVNWFYPPRSDNEYDAPLQVRITAIDGSTITGSFPPYVEGESHEATNQF